MHYRTERDIHGTRRSPGDGVDRAGTYAVITSDPSEMRDVLTLEKDPARQPDTSKDIPSRTSEGHHGQLPDGTR